MNGNKKVSQENDTNEKDKKITGLVEKEITENVAHGVLKRSVRAETWKTLKDSVKEQREKEESEVKTFDGEDELEDVSNILDEENHPKMSNSKVDDNDLSDELTIKTDVSLPDGVKNMEIENSNCLEKTAPRRWCAPAQKFGNMSVIFPWLYNRTGVGIIGPNWVGPILTLSIFSYASQYFARKAMQIGTWSFVICIIFSIVTVVSLFFVVCADPGIFKGGNQSGQSHGYEGIPSHEIDLSGWRYCDLCSLPQPPDAVHCAECNVCVEGYDHFCIWMGTAIGKKNFRAFVIFNMTWFSYLVYGGIWIGLIGPRLHVKIQF